MGRKKNKKKNGSIQLQNIYSDICSECMTKGLLSPSNPCVHSMDNKKEWVVIDSEEYEVRPKPSQQDVMKTKWTGRFFGGTFKRCHNAVPCVNGVDCTFAHNKGELMVWNGVVQLRKTCNQCQWEGALEVAQKKCLSVPKHSGVKKILYLEPHSKSFHVNRPLPRNMKRMKEKSQQFSFKHLEKDCENGPNCSFPHSAIEEFVWNRLLYNGDEIDKQDHQEKLVTSNEGSQRLVTVTEVSEPHKLKEATKIDPTDSEDKSTTMKQTTQSQKHVMHQETPSKVVQKQVAEISEPPKVAMATKKDPAVDRSMATKQTIPNQKYSHMLQVSTKPALPRYSSTHSIDHYGPDQHCLKKEQLNTSVLSEELSQSCYKTKLRTLLYLEETARTDVLERCNGQYEMNYEPRRDFWYILPMQKDSSMTVGLALKFSNAAKITMNDSAFEVYRLRLWFQRHGSEADAGIAFEVGDQIRNLAKVSRSQSVFEVRVEFKFSRNFFRTMHDALTNLSPEAIKKVFPLSSPYNPLGNLIHLKSRLLISLDEDFQMPALKAILHCPPSIPFLLTGPFGTGKTRIIASAANEIATASTGGHVLICVHHHQTANGYVDDYFGPMLRKRHPNMPYVARLIASQQRIPESSAYRHLYKLPRDLQKVKNTIVVSTYTVAALLKKETSFKPGDFAYIFLDEAAQALEPEAIIPLQLANNNTTVVLAGDHLQTGPEDEVNDSTAKKNGLCISLLQRLHRMYCHSENGLFEEKCMKSLLTNYRCHEAILRLPSNLFYDCSLLTRSEQSDPHPKAPYPLVFVCSSLNEHDTCLSGSSESEAKIVVKYTEELLQEWPHRWGRFRPQDICIMTQNHQQQTTVRRWMPRDHHYFDGEQVRVSYAIQGLEFRMVVLSTHESRNYQEGSNLTPGFSVVGERTFNTVLTRAKSLFVAVGNPFYLLDAEEALVASGGQHTYCWREYLKTCADRGSIVFTESPTFDRRKELLERIYKSTPRPSKLRGEDTILEKSKQDLREKIVQWLKRNGVRLYRGKWISKRREDIDRRPPNRPQVSDPGESQDTYTLQTTTTHKGEAIPLNPKQGSFRIIGLKNRRGALEGAIVKVTPISTATQAKSESTAAPLGKVVKVVKQGPEDTFLCRVDPYNSNVMIPLTRKDPKLINSPHIARVLLNDRSTKGQSRQGSVPCFDRMSLQEDSPRLRDAVPFEDAKNMLFLVLFIRWLPKYYLPLGAVIEVYPPGYSLFHAERVLKAQFHIDRDPDDDAHGESPTVPDSVRDLFPEDPPPGVIVDYPKCYTIDDTGSVTLDDALSLKYTNPARSRREYEFAVHIASMAACPDISALIDCAKVNGCTVYSKFGGRTQRYSMLNPRLAQSMSLDENCQRRCISVIGTAVQNRNGSMEIRQEFTLRNTTIISTAKLAYSEVEEVLMLNSGIDDNPGHRLSHGTADRMRAYNRGLTEHEIELAEQLILLRDISLQLEQNRLAGPPQSIFHACQVPQDFDREDYTCPLSKKLVERLMIWANQKVSEYMRRHAQLYPVLLRIQRSPARRNEAILDMLKNSLRSFQDGSMETIRVHRSFIDNLQLRRTGGREGPQNDLRVMNCMHLDRNYPELYSALLKFRKIQSRAAYCRLPTGEDEDDYRHFRLNCFYTHFTSPLRRCFDILVQSVLLAGLNRRQYTAVKEEEIPEIIAFCNRKTGHANGFDKSSYVVSYALKCFDNPAFESTYIAIQEDRRMSLAFQNPELKEVERECSQIPLHTLMYTPGEPNKDGQPTAVWSYRVCCLNDDNYDPLKSAQGLLKLPRSENQPILGNSALICSYTKEQFEGPSSKECFKRHKFSAIQDPTMFTVDTTIWSSLRTLFTGSLGKGMDFQKMTKDLQSSRIAESVTTKKPGGRVLRGPGGNFYAVKFTKALDTGEPFGVWIGVSMQQKIIQPAIQLVEPCPGLLLCVQHCERPSQCFADPVIKCASRSTYRDPIDYLKHWESALLSEAAFNATKARDMVFFKGVGLYFNIEKQVFGQPTSLVRELHFVHKTNAVVEFKLSEDFVKYNWSYFKVKVGDFICARYSKETKNNNTCRAVFHMVVQSVDDLPTVSSEEKDSHPGADQTGANISADQESAQDTDPVDAITPKKISAKFLGELNSIISPAVKQQIERNRGVAVCELQIIPCPVPLRRIYRSLLQLRSERNQERLHCSIACGRFPNPRKLRSDISNEEIANILGRRAATGSIEGGDRIAYKLWKADGLSDIPLNPKQRESLRNALMYKFTLIQGPPGTGKSVTGAHLAYAFAVYNNARTRRSNTVDGEEYCRPVMYCGPSNKSVDRVLGILHTMIQSGCTGGLKRPLRILRLYGKAVERKTHPGPYADENLFELQKSMDYTCPPEYSQYALHDIIRRNNPKLVAADQVFRDMHNNNRTPVSQDIIAYDKLVHAAELRVLNQALFKGEGSEAETYSPVDIVLCTCNEAASFRVRKTLRPFQCIIDEAGMVTEPESMPPIQLTEHVVLIGDHQQLQPVIQSRDAQDRGLPVSLFERYWNMLSKNDQQQLPKEITLTMLTNQYRMHPDICDVVSNVFYDNQLTTDESVRVGYRELVRKNKYLRRFWGGEKPLRFYHVAGAESLQPTSDKTVAHQSKYNPEEARCVVQLANNFVNVEGTPAKSLAIMTPYKGQKREIEQLMKDWAESPKVFTIHESQGD
jgi:exoribonuclease R